jgi:hypothetical protein
MTRNVASGRADAPGETCPRQQPALDDEGGEAVRWPVDGAEERGVKGDSSPEPHERQDRGGDLAGRRHRADQQEKNPRAESVATTCAGQIAVL